MFQKINRFISFNRPVILGRPTFKMKDVEMPQAQFANRILYLLLAALFTGFMVNAFTFALDTELNVAHVSWREYAVCFGQLGWQFIVLSFIRPQKRLDYLGNMSTVSVIGGLLLFPFLIIDYLIDFNWLQLLIGFGMIVGTMFLMHVRRCKRIGLPFLVSISWVTFRTIVLLIVLFFLYL